MFVVDEFLCASYPGLLDRIAEYCRVHSTVIQNVTSPLVVPGGEAVKNTDQCVDLIQNLINSYGICRHSFVVAIGGGAVLDMTGFAAATSHRGVRLLRVPTTVLSQNDSGVGVKTSINRFGKKNFIGTFTPPYAVINDFDFLDSLSDRDWRAGIAEAVKVSLIKDAGFFEFVEASTAALVARDKKTMEYLVHRCAQLHLAHIAGSDPFEMGSPRPLDFGHWSAHKLEQITHTGCGMVKPLLSVLHSILPTPFLLASCHELHGSGRSMSCWRLDSRCTFQNSARRMLCWTA